MKKLSNRQKHYFQQKGKVAILKATEKAFGKVGNAFTGYDLWKLVARYTGRPSVYPDTVLRIARLLKQRGVVSFYCIDHINSLYHKGDQPW